MVGARETELNPDDYHPQISENLTPTTDAIRQNALQSTSRVHVATGSCCHVNSRAIVSPIHCFKQRFVFNQETFTSLDRKSSSR